MIKLSNENFDELIKGKTILVDFYADWCGPCRMLAPVLEEASTKFDTEIIKVNVDEHEEIAKKYGVMSIPTLIVFENGTEKYTIHNIEFTIDNNENTVYYKTLTKYVDK